MSTSLAAPVTCASVTDCLQTLCILPRAEVLSVHTGNIINWNQLKRNITQSATAELDESVQCRHTKYLEKLLTEERQEYKITVKIFISELQKDTIEDAIKKVMEDLGVTSVETVILSVPDQFRCLNNLVELWHMLEGEVEANRVYSLGVSDLSITQLQELYEAVKVKPCINQVNLTTCCVIPPELTTFAKDHHIQLLTHNDPPVADCQSVLGEALTQRDAQLWQPTWVVRYSVLIKARGIIKSKGYILQATRDLKLCKDHC